MSTTLERTVLPPQTVANLSDVFSVLDAPGAKEIVGPGGTSARLPDDVVAAIRSMVQALQDGQAITLAPHNMVMTTQDAADFLGVSRPTLVRLLERGEIRFQRPGRHRKILLADLLEYQREATTERRQLLDDLSREAADGVASGGGFETTR